MTVWVIRDAEPLPIDPGNKRLMRIGTLCQALVDRGHDVTWITSTFDHYQKRHRADASVTCPVSDAYRIELLKGPGYTANISVRRILHNRAFAKAFERFAAAAGERPDIMITDIPTTETAAAVVRTARRLGVPSLLSIRDLWPDFFTNFLPAAVRPLAGVALRPLHAQAAYACRNADVLVGISQAYFDWGLRKGRRARRANDAIVPLGYRVSHAADSLTDGDRRGILSAMGVDGDRHLVSFVGTWGVTSDLETVAAAAELMQHRTDIQFVIAGKADPGDPVVPKMQALKNVRLPGWLDERQINVLLDRTTVGLLPYQGAAPQGLPNKLFAYMSHGAFQVSTLGGEAAAMLKQHRLGSDVAPHDPAAMASAIADAIDRQASPASRQRIKAYFDANFRHGSVYGRFVDIIERAAARNPE